MASATYTRAGCQAVCAVSQNIAAADPVAVYRHPAMSSMPYKEPCAQGAPCTQIIATAADAAGLHTICKFLFIMHAQGAMVTAASAVAIIRLHATNVSRGLLLLLLLTLALAGTAVASACLLACLRLLQDLLESVLPLLLHAPHVSP